MSRILVTGASGFIGKRFIALHSVLGDEVITVGKDSGDVAEEKTWQCYPQADVVIHLAGRSFVPDSWTNPMGFLRSNALGVVGALEYCRKHCASLVYLSSYLYGDPTFLPIPESAPLIPTNPYALSKIISEEVCQFYAERFSINITILRPFNVFGPGQSDDFLIPSILRQARRNCLISVKDLEPRRDYIYVDDVVQAIILSIKKIDGFQIYNLGSGQSYSVAQVIDVIQSLLGSNLPISVEGVRRKGEVMDTIADISQANALLGWVPEWDLKRGIAQLAKESS